MFGSGRLARLAILVLCLTAVFAGVETQAWAQSELIRVNAQGPVDIRADYVEYDERTLAYSARGEVEIKRGAVSIYADKVRLDSQTLVAEAEGRVRMVTVEHVMTGDRMAIDLQASTGKIYNGIVFVKANHYYLNGEEIEKTGRDTFKLRNGFFTTCDGSDPDWKFTGKELDVTLDGYGRAEDSTFRFMDVPLIWLPKVIFPAKFKRQSGLLAPMMGMSDRDGFVYNQPYFLTLGEDQDATITLNMMTKRGVDLGLEYRYNRREESKGMVMFDFMPEDGMASELHEKGEIESPYNTRYWFRMKSDGTMFDDLITVKTDIDLVSDVDFLKEFNQGHSGYSSSLNRFSEWFGRDLDPRTSTIRTSKVNFARSWTNTSFNGTFYYYDNLLTDNKRTLQELPYLSYTATRQALGETGLYFWMKSYYRYYYRENGATGNVADLSPSVSLPLNFNDYLTLEPRFTYSPRLYAVTADDWDRELSSGAIKKITEDPDHNKTGISQDWKFQTLASTYLFRVFDFGSAEDPFKIKHAMRPNVTYTFRPNQEDEEEDMATLARRNITLTNQVAYGINNTFTSKVMGKNETTGDIEPIYQEFLRIAINHSFDLARYRGGNDPVYDRNRYWGAVTGRLEFEPSDYIYVEADTSWNLYDNRFTRINAEVSLEDKRGDSITLDYRNTYDRVNQLRAELKVAINQEWSVSYINHKDFKEEFDFEETYEVAYEGQCWGIKAMVTDSHFRDSGFWLVFSLGGFGDIFGYGQMNSSTN